MNTVGLDNIGNTCYLNASIQSLNSILDKKLLSKISSDSKDKFGLVSSFRDLILEMNSNNSSSTVCPRNFKEIFAKTFPEFKGFNQEDAHEFILKLIDFLHTRTNPSEKNMFSSFYGTYYTRIECNICNYKTRKNKNLFSIISLPVDTDFSSCFDEYINTEVIDWKCSKCKRMVEAEKDTDFEKLPKVLIVHFKRFTSDLKKINKTVNFTKYIKYENLSFELTSIICHNGTCNYGHYYNYSKIGNDWFCLNDSSVKKIDNISKSDAYILFYKLVKKTK